MMPKGLKSDPLLHNEAFFLVEGDDDGVEIGKRYATMKLRLAPVSVFTTVVYFSTISKSMDF